jgi:hypothetical protein
MPVVGGKLENGFLKRKECGSARWSTKKLTVSSKARSDPLPVVVGHRADEREHVCARGFDCILDQRLQLPQYLWTEIQKLTSSPTTPFINGSLKLRTVSSPTLNIRRGPRPKELRNALHLLIVIVS